VKKIRVDKIPKYMGACPRKIKSENPSYGSEASTLDWKDLCSGRVIWMWKNIEDI
jgi:hypothetical protein